MGRSTTKSYTQLLARVAVQRIGGRETVGSLARRERHPEAVRAL